VRGLIAHDNDEGLPLGPNRERGGRWKLKGCNLFSGKLNQMIWRNGQSVPRLDDLSIVGRIENEAASELSGAAQVA
jgi:hypothetical protein